MQVKNLLVYSISNILIQIGSISLLICYVTVARAIVKTSFLDYQTLPILNAIFKFWIVNIIIQPKLTPISFEQMRDPC